LNFFNISSRPFAEGISPHIFNRPGMDALETVFALIEEGHTGKR